MEKMRNANIIMVGKLERLERPFGMSRRRWKKNIKIYIRESGWGRVGWIQLARDRD
jgi:hypothetical protein